MIIIKKVQDSQSGRESVAIYENGPSGVPVAIVQHLKGKGLTIMRMSEPTLIHKKPDEGGKNAESNTVR